MCWLSFCIWLCVCVGVYFTVPAHAFVCVHMCVCVYVCSSSTPLLREDPKVSWLTQCQMLFLALVSKSPAHILEFSTTVLHPIPAIYKIEIVWLLSY